MHPDEKQLTHLSKFLSMVLRHKPETIGLTLDAQGWADVKTLIQLMNKQGKRIDVSLLTMVVETNAKQRFAFSPDRSKIRASQGHSVEVDLGYAPKVPPLYLYHGTAVSSAEGIYASGIQKRDRHHVHLSLDRQTALKVGQRHGIPIILKVFAVEMHQNGFVFFESENGVWLTDHVPASYLVKEEN